ncbi:sn-glycerol-3-phosphate transport system permease protein UgpA [Clostridium puniceum]|uniref:sn-glycerol-3-phosphate transport system permease protein UgpA n=1 Tax=Clostridium puniceum TaxID=29367 RepID=A0A1S8THR9_9CLOT|nr:sugar ABC transporter permease [Clostridium puniceum]OOM77298.1 sn-glycerol-3-phosphate transport system permease protein UgpA [Clostridium puniceum]
MTKTNENATVNSSDISTKNIKKKLNFSSLPYKKQKIVISIAFLIIPVILLTVFTYIPAISMFGYSFTDWDGISKTKNFIGLKNYQTMFSDIKYWQPLFVSIYYFIATFVQIGLAVIVAYLVSFGCKASGVFKGVYFFPSLVNSVAIGFVFIFFFQPGSTLDTVLNMVGLGGLTKLWLQDTSTNNISLAFVSVWRYVGYNIVMFSAAMASISSDILEAARVDGANKFQQLRHIILPGISTILGLQLFLSITGALSAFETPYIMTNGGNGTMTFIIQTVQYAFQNHRVGLASAMAMVLLLICIIVTSIQNYVMNRKG